MQVELRTMSLDSKAHVSGGAVDVDKSSFFY